MNHIPMEKNNPVTIQFFAVILLASLSINGWAGGNGSNNAPSSNNTQTPNQFVAQNMAAATAFGKGYAALTDPAAKNQAKAALQNWVSSFDTSQGWGGAEQALLQ